MSTTDRTRADVIMVAEEVRPGDYLGDGLALVTSAEVVGDSVVIGATLTRPAGRAAAGTPLVRVLAAGAKLSARPHYLVTGAAR